MGLGLALVYMTVLGFDNITVGYAYSQGISEDLVGIAMALGSAVGIVGSLSYPFLTKCGSLRCAGLVGFTSQIIATSACVISIFLSGSPFSALTAGTQVHQLVPDDNINITVRTTVSPVMNSSYVNTVNVGSFIETTRTGAEQDYTSITVMLSGIIAARFGLYIIDLSITQMMQEKVAENERGRINGVQFSLNMLMGMIKFALVVSVPKPEDFGYLTIASLSFILLGFVSFVIGR